MRRLRIAPPTPSAFIIIGAAILAAVVIFFVEGASALEPLQVWHRSAGTGTITQGVPIKLKAGTIPIEGHIYGELNTDRDAAERYYPLYCMHGPVIIESWTRVNAVHTVLLRWQDEGALVALTFPSSPDGVIRGKAQNVRQTEATIIWYQERWQQVLGFSGRDDPANELQHRCWNRIHEFRPGTSVTGTYNYQRRTLTGIEIRGVY